MKKKEEKLRIHSRIRLESVTMPEYRGFDHGMDIFMRDDAPDPMDFTEAKEAPTRRKK